MLIVAVNPLNFWKDYRKKLLLTYKGYFVQKSEKDYGNIAAFDIWHGKSLNAVVEEVRGNML